MTHKQQITECNHCGAELVKDSQDCWCCGMAEIQTERPKAFSDIFSNCKEKLGNLDARVNEMLAFYANSTLNTCNCDGNEKFVNEGASK